MGRKSLNPTSIWKCIQVTQPADCWPWLRSVDRNGYGKLQIHGKNWKAHRYICALVHGERDSTWLAIHSCDNRRCCNPAHLRWGTPQENSDDRMIRGRQAPYKKISPEDRSIAVLLFARGVRPRIVAEVIGCSIKHAMELKSQSEFPPTPPLAGS